MALPHGQSSDGDIEMGEAESDDGSLFGGEVDPNEEPESEGLEYMQQEEFDQIQYEIDLQDQQQFDAELSRQEEEQAEQAAQAPQFQSQPPQNPAPSQTQQRSGQGQPSQQAPAQSVPEPSYQDAVLWRDAPEYAYRRSIFASQHYVSYERVNDYTFYLNNVDSRLLYDQIYKHHPENFPPAPRPVPVQNQPNEPPAGMHDPDRGGDPTRGMGQQPGRGMPARGGPSAAGRGGIPGQGNHPQTRTQDLPSAGLWTDPAGYIRPRYDASQNLPSRQERGHPSRLFHLSAEDSNTLRAIIRQDPRRYPGPPSEVLNAGHTQNSLGRSRGRGRRRPRGRERGHGGGGGQQLLGLTQPAGYEGPAAHGTVEQYRYALRNNYPPEQYGLYYEEDWVGPPIDQVNQEIANAWQTPEREAYSGEEAATPSTHQGRNTGDTNKVSRKDAPFDGLLEQHHEWWGSFIDDGPRKPGETERAHTARIKKARFNMQIERRVERPVAPREPGQNHEDRKRQTADFRKDINKAIDTHNHKMNPYHPGYDKGYATRWRNMKATRKSHNNARRLQELTYVRQEYARRGLPRPPTPEPAEDSCDEDALYEEPKAEKPGGEDEDSEADDDDTVPNWDADPAIFARYRAAYPDREHMRCEFCKKRRKQCTHEQKPFPCDRCREHGILCVRLCWSEGSGPGAPRGAVGERHSRGLQLYIPSLYVRQQLGAAAPESWRIGDPDPPSGSTGTTAVPILRPPRPSNAALAAAAAAAANAAAPTPPNEPIIHCARCVTWGLPCHKTRPCWSCIQAGERDSCDAQIQNQQFGEKAPDDGEYSVMHDNVDDYDYSNIDPRLITGQPFGGGATWNRFGSGVGQAQPLAPPHPIDGAIGNLFGSVNAGVLPFKPAPLPGHQVVPPAGPTPGPRPGQVHVPGEGWKRPLPEDDSDIYDDPRAPKRLKGTNASNEALALAWAVEDSQINMYDHSGNSGPNTETQIDLDDFLIFDESDDDGVRSPAQPATPRATVPVYTAPTWQLTDLPPKPPSGAGSADPDDLSKECKENRDHWKRAPWNNCRKAPAKDCEHIMDNLTCSCKRCNNDQNRNVEPRETDTINTSKLFCCADCDQLVQRAAEGGVPNVHLGNCFCSWQLNRTWICNSHRETAHDELKRIVGINKQAYISQNPGTSIHSSYNLCPGCKMFPANRGSTWQCVACETYVYKDPMTP